MDIRKADISDIKTIQDLAELIWRPTYGHILSEEQTVYMLDLMYSHAKLTLQLNSAFQFFIASIKNEAIGYFSFEQISAKEGRLHKIYIHPTKKPKGAGTHIMNYVKQIAREQGIETIELNVNKYNSAVDFYLKKGFVIDSEMVLNIGNGYVMDDYVMKLSLK